MKTQKAPLTAQVDPEIKLKIEAIADKEDRSISYIVNRLLKQVFKN